MGRSLHNRSIPLLGEAEHLQANVVEELVDVRAPSLQIHREGLQRGDVIDPLIADLMDAHQLEVAHAELEVEDAIVKVGSPIVGNNGRCCTPLGARPSDPPRRRAADMLQTTPLGV